MNEYVIMLDTETTNDIESPIMYDCGFMVVDLATGEVIERHSYVIADVFLDAELMSTAYFADKITQYWEDIHAGKRKLVKLSTCKRILCEVANKYEVQYIVAHNARFDYRATQGTQRYMTSSKYRFFLPYGVHMVDTLKMARQKFGKDDDYGEFCYNNNYLTKRGQRRYTAEILYRFLSGNADFEEAHTGVEDCEIEKQILMECLKSMDIEEGVLW